jgi:glutamate-1-semialdehyde 2,1-aminomutase
MVAATQPTEQAGLIERAKGVLAGGGFGNFATDIVVTDGKAGRVRDANGKEYVDFLLGSGPMLIGHGHPEVLEAVHARLDRGTTFFANNDAGIRLAEEIVAAVPSAEKLRYTSSGSEATAYAMRAIRAFMGRSKILKFEGGYHGMSDYALQSLAPTRKRNDGGPVADSAGIPEAVGEQILLAPFNDLQAAAAIIEQHKSELAGVIVEPFQRVINPASGFLQGLRDATAKAGIPLVFDEIVTGFRWAYGGAQAYYGVTPDLCTLGKVIGGGFPLAALTGKAEIMKHFDKAAVGEGGFLPQIGTLSGNPIAAEAGLATLRVLKRPGTYERLFATGEALMAGLREALKKAGVVAQVTGVGAMFDVIFTDQPIVNYWNTASGDKAKLARFDATLRQNGVLKGNTKYYVSTAHTADDVAQTIDAFHAAAKAVAAA